ncbi:glycosyltransferase family 39 protein [Bifidobacterium moraviense]|uniref:glycosyltransferase family 39 protein n=1 Tax=Bifidobacterium moraviense TaxID=2675323 RepID=UPI00145F4669|nr:glycosyltransferase family 39 protein [Bifidobacterium sp. DSM 109958]
MSERVLLWLAVTAYFLMLCYIAYRLPFSEYPKAFPDEDARLSLPQYFYDTGRLPTGAEEAVRYPGWGFSYASYPLMLTTLVAGVLMKVMGLFTSNPDWIVFAARLVSITSASAVVYFAFRTGRVLFGRPLGYLFGLFPMLLPQFIFCGLYFNNDMPALCGASMVLYAWALALRNGWQPSNAVLLGAGMGIVAVTYYNAYSWILLSLVCYACVWHSRVRDWGFLRPARSAFWRITGLIVGVTAIIALPFFIRAAVINHGDFLGFATIRRYGMQYAVPELRPDLRPTPQHLGMSLGEMLTTDHYMGAGTNWLLMVYKSSIGLFGYMAVPVPNVMYWAYGVFIVAGLVGFLLACVRRLHHRGDDDTYAVLDALMFANIVLVMGLAMYYSYATDYQAQGRYVLPMLLSVVYFVVGGWRYWVRTLVSRATPSLQTKAQWVFVAAAALLMLFGDYVAIAKYLLV